MKFLFTVDCLGFLEFFCFFFFLKQRIPKQFLLCKMDLRNLQILRKLSLFLACGSSCLSSPSVGCHFPWGCSLVFMLFLSGGFHAVCAQPLLAFHSVYHICHNDKEIFGYGFEFVVFIWSLSRVWLCHPMGWSMPLFSIICCLPEFAQIHVHWVSDAM